MTVFAIVTQIELSVRMSLVYAILYRVAASLLTGLHFCTYIFSVITMSLFGLQVCSGNYQKITNTNPAAKKTANVQKQATTIFYNVGLIQITVY